MHASIERSSDSTLLAAAMVLAVDDELAARKMLSLMLNQQGIACKTAASTAEALEILKNETIHAVISDLRMSGLSGFELLRAMRSTCPNVAFIMATGVADLRVAVQAMKEGADDYLLKPFDIDLVIASLARALQHKALEREVDQYRRNLEQMVAERTQQLQSAMLQLEHSYGATLEALGSAIDLRDAPTAGHSRRVLCYSTKIAAKLAPLGVQLKTLAMGAWLHDIGKLAIPDRILLKPGPLTDDELTFMKRHVEIGCELVGNIPFLKEATELIRAHHERYDGTGYPAGLRGEQIPVYARIFSVADALDAITSDRPYRKANTFRYAREVIAAGSGTQFDPKVVDAALSIPEAEWERIVLQAKTAAFSEITGRTETNCAPVPNQ